MERLSGLVFASALLVTVAVTGCRTSRGEPALRDADGNAYALKTMPDGRTWMTDNLRLNRPDSYCYQGSASECHRFGRLYTWLAAADACLRLGATWRLPTDDEWRLLADAYDGGRGASRPDRRAAYVALLNGGPSGFNALLGGGREIGGRYARREEHGLYWTATESDPEHAVYYNFGRGGGMLHRQGEGEKGMALTVRCIAST
jgi:uncharacterized protein (TIGR02145 family)